MLLRGRFAITLMLLWQETIALIAYLVLYLCFTYPAIRYFRDAFFGGVRGDPGIYVWLIENNARNVLSLPSQGFDINLFYPFGNALAYTDNFLLPSLLAKICFALGWKLATTFNLLYLVCGTLNGYSVYLLGRELSLGRISSFLGGAFFLASPFLYSHLGHPQLQFAFFVVLALHATLKTCRTASVLASFFIGLWILLAFLTSVYYALFSILLCALTLLGAALLRRQLFSVKFAAVLVLPNLVWIFGLYTLSQPYREVYRAFGPRRIQELKPFTTSLLAYLAAPTSSTLWGGITSPWTNYESYLYPGLVVLIGAIVALFSVRKIAAEEIAKRPIALAIQCLALLSIAVLLAVQTGVFSITHLYLVNILVCIPAWLLLFYWLLRMGLRGAAAVGASGHFTACELSLLFIFLFWFFAFASFGLVSEPLLGPHVPSLSKLLFACIPGFDSLRATGRIGLVAQLCLIVLAMISMDRLWNKPRTQLRSSGFALALLVFGFSALDLRQKDFPLVGEDRETMSYLHLATMPGPGAAIALPFGFIGDSGSGFALMQTEYMRWIQVSNRPMVNGYSGKMPQFHEYLDLKTRHFPDTRSLEYLGRIVGLRFVFFNPRFAQNFDAASFEAKAASFSPTLKLILKDTNGNYIFEFRPIQIVKTSGVDVFVPPSAKPDRRLNFEARSVGGVELEAALIRDKISVNHRRYQTLSTAEWKEFEYILPTSFSPVIPDKLRFRSLPADAASGVEIRNIRLD